MSDRTTTPIFLTVPQLRKRSGLGAHLIRAAIRSGELRAFRPHEGGWPRVRLDEFERWIEYRESRSAEQRP